MLVFGPQDSRELEREEGIIALLLWQTLGTGEIWHPFSLALFACRRGKHLVNNTYYSSVRMSCILESYRADLRIE